MVAKAKTLVKCILVGLGKSEVLEARSLKVVEVGKLLGTV